MFAQHIGVHMLCVHAQLAPQERPKAGRVKRRPRTHDPMDRRPHLPSNLGGQVGGDVHGVGGHDQAGVGRMAQHTGHHVAKDDGVALQQLQACLARLLIHTRSDHHGAAARQIRVVSRPDGQRVRKGHGMIDVVGLGLGPFVIQVDQHDLPAHIAHHHGIGRRRTDKPTADDPNLAAHIICHYSFLSLSSSNPVTRSCTEISRRRP